MASPPAPENNPSPTRGLRASDAQLCGWIGLALVNVVFIEKLSMPRGGHSLRALHHLYDAAQLVGAGLIVAAVVAAWQRWGPRRAVWAYVAIALVAVAVGAFALADDVSGPAVDLGGDAWSNAWTAVLVTAVALGIPGAAIAGRILSLRPWLRPLGVVGALIAAVGNHLILKNDYPGAHLYLAWAAATLFGASMTGAHLGAARTGAPTPARRWVGWGVRGVLAVACGYALVVWPRQSLVVQLGRINGAVLVPFLARQHQHAARRTVAVPEGAGPWFSSRDKAPEIPASSPSLVPKNPIVIFVTVDSFRADVLESEENRRKLPRITEILGQSVYFTQARSPAVSTRTSLGSVFTGKYRSQLHWSTTKRKGSNLGADHSPKFTDLLVKAGFPTFTAVSYPPLANRIAIVSGFTEQRFSKRFRGQDFPLSEAQTDDAIDRLESLGEGPLFLYMHFMDAHDPYDAAGVKATPYESYVAELGLCDDSVGRIFNTLERKGLLDRTVFVLSADHGEGLGQHETPHHNLTLYEELVRVPLLIRVPGVPARRVDDRVGLIDVGPTLLDLVGLPTPGAFMGQSLVPYLRGENPKLLRPIAADTGAMRSILLDRDKVIQNDLKGSEEIYDLSRDPGEEDNLFDDLGEAAAPRMAVLQMFFDAHRLRGERRSRGGQDRE